LISTEATPCGHFSKNKLSPENPPIHGRHGHGSPEKSLKIFKVLLKKKMNKIRTFERPFRNLYLAEKLG
jgi:hypothetical protein